MEIKRSIKWDDRAIQNLNKGLNWISETSVKQAELVEKTILETIEKAAINPERFPPDKFKKSNPGLFRAFEAKSYRVSFSFNDQEIRITRVRHVKQQPLEY